MKYITSAHLNRAFEENCSFILFFIFKIIKGPCFWSHLVPTTMLVLITHIRKEFNYTPSYRRPRQPRKDQLNILNIYGESFSAVSNEGYWQPYEGNIVCHNEHMQRLKKGRPHSARERIQAKSDPNRLVKTHRQRLPKKMWIKSIPGHNRKQCPNIVGRSN